MATGIDYYNPVLKAAIVLPDGKTRFPLWTQNVNIADAVSVNLASSTGSLPFLSQVTVELQLAYLPIIKATLTPPYTDAIAFLDSKLIEWTQSTLEVQFGYVISPPNEPGGAGVAVLSDVYSGILLKPEIELGSDVVITLTAQGVGGFGAVRAEGNVTMADCTREDIVRRLIAPFPTLNLDDTEVTKLQSTARAQVAEWNSTRLPAFSQGGETYWQAIQRILREVGLLSYLFGNTLRVIPQSFAFGSAPSKLFSFYGFPGGRIGSIQSPTVPSLDRVIPILSASSPTMALYMPAAAQGLYAQDVNSSDRSEQKQLIGDAQANPARTSKGAASVDNTNISPTADPTTGDGAQMYPGNPADEQLATQMKAEYGALTSAMGVQLNLETLGDPTILPGMVIMVTGLGKRLSTNMKYSIFKVTHTLSTSAYTLSLECVSNVGSVLQNAVEAGGPVSPTPPYSDNDGILRGTVPINVTPII